MKLNVRGRCRLSFFCVVANVERHFFLCSRFTALKLNKMKNKNNTAYSSPGAQALAPAHAAC